MSNTEQMKMTRARSTIAAGEKPEPRNRNAKRTQKVTTANKRKAQPKAKEIPESEINDVKRTGKRRKTERVSAEVGQKNVDENIKRVSKLMDDETESVKGKTGRKRKMEVTEIEEATLAKAVEEAIVAKDVEEASPAKRAKEPTQVKKVEPGKIAEAGVRRQKVVLEVPKLQTISGTLFVVGNNEIGQLGLINVVTKTRPAENTIDVRFVDVAAGGMHSLCLTDKGEIYTFGCNDESALGRQTGDDEVLEQTPMKVDIPHVVVKISAGDCHSAALTENGQVYIWGTFRDSKGTIGLTPQVFKSNNPLQILQDVTIVDIASGSEHFVCLSNRGDVYTCGCAETGQLGRIPERSSKGNRRKGLVELLEPKVVPLRKRGRTVPISNIWAGADYTFLKSQTNGDIYAFGLNNYYQIGLPLKVGEMGVDGPCSQYVPVKIDAFSSNVQWQCISGGQHHTIALDDNGLVHVLGRKEYGRLGLGENCDHTQVPTIVPALAQQKCVYISCGDQVSFSIADDGTLYSWGFGTNHQLGHGNDDDVFEPQIVEGKFRSAWNAFKISGGGQHTLILAKPKEAATNNPHLV